MRPKPLIAIFALAVASGLAGPALANVQAGLNAWAQNDYATATREWQGPAASGDPDAQFLLAEAYKQGLGVTQDLTKAEALFGKAAAQGHLQAADIYGLLLFDRGQRAQAMPYIRTAAERGEPRAQYLLGLAHFNGDLAAKDWVRAYALVSLAQQAGLARAKPTLAQMDQYIELPQRQQAAALASELASRAEANLARQQASLDLGQDTASRQPPPPRTAGARATGTDSPRTAGADYTRPAGAVSTPPAPLLAAAPAVARPAAFVSTVTNSGPWRIQLGAFGLAANANALWNRLRSRPELAGHPRINVPAGSVIKLQAGGFASRAAAQAACARLASGGVSCLAVR